MFLRELIEGATPVFGKRGNKMVRKYRCTSGSRKGRVVAKPTTCTAPKNVKASRTMKLTRAARGSSQAKKTARTKATNATSVRIRNVNKSGRRKATRRSGSRRKKI
jgi:hypothetical protein